MARKRSQRDLESLWVLWGRENFSGNRKCKGCGEVKFCIGKTYERQFCRECHMSL